MGLFWIKPEIKLSNIRNLFSDNMERRDDPSKTFISRASLQDIWHDERLKAFGKHYGAFPKSEVVHIKENLLQTLSILVAIKWDQWDKFESKFLKYHRRTDKDIPRWEGPILEGLLGIDGSNFLNTRYTYCPVDIKEGEDRTLGPGWRLPFLHSKDIGRGGYGTVTREHVASGHLLYEDENRNNSGQRFIACKRFGSHADFEREKTNLQIIQRQLRANKGILSFFTTITIGQQSNVFFECADMDLDQFLSSRPESVGLRDLIAESCALAGALASLQEDIDPGLLLCHMDLKPTNILVFKRPNLGRAFEWKISDFGTSIISATQEPRPMDAPDITFPYPFMRLSGTYHSPEVSNGNGFGRKSDVWSLGCILVRILAFGLDHGPDQLAELDRKRARSDDDSSNHKDDCFHRGKPPMRNRHIEAWLNKLPSRTDTGVSREVLARLRDLLLWTLEINIKDRPSAEEVKSSLEQILHSLPHETPSTPDTDDRRGSNPTSELTPSTTSSETHQNMMELAMNADFDVETVARAPTGKSDRMLIHAIRRGAYEVVDALLRRPDVVDKESLDSDGNTPLNCAISLSDHQIAICLLQAGVNVNAPSRTGITPLMQATRRGNLCIVKMLLSLGANCMAISNAGYTCLHFVAWAPHGGAELIQEFKTRMNVDTYTEEAYETPLKLLIREQTKERNAGREWRARLNAFIEAGADVNFQDREGKTPLFHAVQNKLELVTMILLDRDAIMGPRHPSEHFGWTPGRRMKDLIHERPELQPPSRAR